MADYLVKIKDASGFEIHGQIKVDGQRTTTFGRLPEEIADNIHNMVNLPVRDDDVMFSTAPKSGMSLHIQLAMGNGSRQKT